MTVKRHPLLALMPAILGTYILGVVLATQMNLAELEALGVRITLRDRLHASGHDLLGLSVTYLPAISAALLVAFPAAGYLARWAPWARLALYLLAGASALVGLHLIAKAVLGLNHIAGARGIDGLFLQAIAGSFGAYIYYVATGWAHRSFPSRAVPRRA